MGLWGGIGSVLDLLPSKLRMLKVTALLGMLAPRLTTRSFGVDGVDSGKSEDWVRRIRLAVGPEELLQAARVDSFLLPLHTMSRPSLALFVHLFSCRESTGTGRQGFARNRCNYGGWV